jgi:predicted ATPase
MDNRAKELAADLLKSQHHSETNWVVITGAPCAGKTTVLNELKKLGYPCCQEVARAFIERSISQGMTLEQIRADESKFQNALIQEKLQIEKESNPAAVIFFDRAMPDTVTYYRISGLDPDSALKYCFYRRYRRVFILDPLEFENDNARTEDPETVQFLDEWLEKDYRALGYDVIRVPVMTVAERINFILHRV